MNFFEGEIVLEDKRVLLRNLRQEDFEGLKLISYEEGMWEYNPMCVYDDKSLQLYLDKMSEEYKLKTRIPFVVIDKETGITAGSSSYLNIAMHDKRLEIGSTFYGSEFRGTGLNRNCKYLLISYAFDKMNIERVEFKTDVLNLRSRRALTKIGAFEEGVLRSHMILHNGRRRDSIYFSILKNEWEFVKQNYFAELV
jgi:RimJ/RimL family protein N-acetyltransferase